MEIWIIYWLIGAIFVGIVNFYWKIIATKKLNRNRIFTYSMFSMTLVSILFLIFNYNYTHVAFLIIIISIIRVMAGLEKQIFTVESLKYIESSLFFPIHKITHIFLAFLVWIFFFQEYLSLTELSAILLWVVVVLLLSDKKSRNKQIDYKKWFLFLIISNLFLLVASSINKYIAYINFDIWTYMFITSLSGALYLCLTKKDVFDTVDKATKIKEMQMWFSRWLFSYIWFFLVVYALQDWPFVLVQVLVVLSIFIPIILSVIIFKEKLNFKKILAFILLIVVIYLISI